MLIARPYSEYAVEWTTWALQQPKIRPSIIMSDDVAAIVEEEIREMESGRQIQVSFSRRIYYVFL